MKKVIALILALILGMSLAACGKSTLETIRSSGIYYITSSDNEIHYVFKDGIVYKQTYKTVKAPNSPSGKLNVQDKKEEIAEYKDLTDSSITIIDGNQTKEYTYSMDEDNFKVKFSSNFLDSGTSSFLFR